MKIIEDKSQELEDAKNKLIDKIIDQLKNIIIKCNCGVTFQLDDISDINLSTSPFDLPSESITARCPKCRNISLITYRVDYLYNNVDDEEIWELVYRKIYKLKKAQKKSFIQKIKDHFNEKI